MMPDACPHCRAPMTGRSSSKIGGVSEGKIAYACGYAAEWGAAFKATSECSNRTVQTLDANNAILGGLSLWR
jgi:hypothetical protein